MPVLSYSAAPVTSQLRSHLTLGLCTILHAFTHAYGTLLVPLYLLVTQVLGLQNNWFSVILPGMMAPFLVFIAVISWIAARVAA